MTDDINKKVINIFSKHKNSEPSAHDERVKFFAGFNYVKINKDGISKVIEEKCTACGKCVSACPKNIIRILPFKSKHTVLCSSKEKGIVAKKMCEVSCIACGICAKNCPENAIIVENNLAKIDFIKCTNCGICKTKCPTKAIEGI